MDEKPKNRSWLRGFVKSKPVSHTPDHIKEEVILRPALRQLGTAPCPVCQRETAVFLTRTSRPFQNCGFCSLDGYVGNPVSEVQMFGCGTIGQLRRTESGRKTR